MQLSAILCESQGYNLVISRIQLRFASSFSVVWGDCNHSFHNCCMSLWVVQNNRCPLCQQEWVVQKVGR